MYKLKDNISLILASTSPRRRELIKDCGLDFKIVSPECDESIVAGESANNMVERLALEKALSVAEKENQSWVIGADTTVSIEGEILGKPTSTDDACQMLSRIQGRWHEVLGGVALVRGVAQFRIALVFSSFVKLVPLTDNEIMAYVSTGEPMDKAGSYAIQGIGASIVERVEGSYTNVVGLNISELLHLLKNNNVIEIQ